MCIPPYSVISVTDNRSIYCGYSLRELAVSFWTRVEPIEVEFHATSIQGSGPGRGLVPMPFLSSTFPSSHLLKDLSRETSSVIRGFAANRTIP
jgi:hypothetical protein